MIRSKSLPHVDLKRLKLQKQDSNLSEDSSSGFKDSGIERDDNLANSNSDIQQDFPSLQSSSSGAIEPVNILFHRISVIFVGFMDVCEDYQNELVF